MAGFDGVFLPHLWRNTCCSGLGLGSCTLHYVRAGGPQATRLQQVLLSVVDHNICSQRDWWGSSAKTTMDCAGRESKSARHGDSGGPLNCRAHNNRWYVEGVTSFVDGRGSNTPKRPTIFTRVASFIPWISE
ncbi:hypothetical protein AMECASPLE_014314, partial [Ameca splendens]